MRTLNIERQQKNFSSPAMTADTLAACFSRIMTKVREEGYSPETIDYLRKDIDTVKEKLPLNDDQVILISAILEECSTGRCSDTCLANFLGCNNIEFMTFRDTIEDLEIRRIIRNFQGRGGKTYRIDSDLLAAVEKNVSYVPRSLSGISTNEMFTWLRIAFHSYYEETHDVDVLLRDINEVLDNNIQNEFTRKYLASGIRDCSESEQRMFCYMCHRYVSHGNAAVEIDRLESLFEDFGDTLLWKRAVAKEKTALQKKGLVGFANEEGFVDNTRLTLSDSVKNGFFSEVDIVVEKAQHKDVKSWKDITAKELFYNPREESQINRLENLLEEKNFAGVLERLSRTGMRRNFTILLTGGPGVGKTETCLQIARKTQRDIFYVDMSKLKSKWFGESEKIVNSIFGIYKNLVRNSDKAPILLLNECDAIMGTRYENVQSSTEQSENTIQNILLQNMENLEGIMICTTNLAQNLDSAFSRRFLYKIELEAPQKEARARIWMAMMPALSEDDAATLASEYDFAGGNIENVSRKSTVEYILSGREPGLELLRNFSDEEMEKGKSVRAKVGY